jgi:hypothetical protein
MARRIELFSVREYSQVKLRTSKCAANVQRESAAYRVTDNPRILICADVYSFVRGPRISRYDYRVLKFTDALSGERTRTRM